LPQCCPRSPRCCTHSQPSAAAAASPSAAAFHCVQALADYQKRSLMLGGVPASVLPKIPKVQRLAAGMGGRGGGRGGEFRRSGSTGTFGGRPGGQRCVCVLTL
jgi:hypothetical protein